MACGADSMFSSGPDVLMYSMMLWGTPGGSTTPNHFPRWVSTLLTMRGPTAPYFHHFCRWLMSALFRSASGTIATAATNFVAWVAPLHLQDPPPAHSTSSVHASRSLRPPAHCISGRPMSSSGHELVAVVEPASAYPRRWSPMARCA